MLQQLQSLCRKNTGSHFLDSGSAYGYKYEQPNSQEFNYDMGKDEEGNEHIESISIGLPHFLNKILVETEYSKTVNKVFAEMNKDDTSAENDFDHICELMNLKQVTRDNTYNHDNDLDQVLLYTVFIPNNQDKDDWVYTDRVLIAIQPHCGCDVRGGYPDPVFYEFANKPAELYSQHIGFSFFYSSDDDKQLSFEVEGMKLDFYEMLKARELDVLELGYSDYVWNKIPNNCKMFKTDINDIVLFKFDDGFEIEAQVVY